MDIDLISYIANRTPQYFLQSVSEALDTAYFQSNRESLTYDEPERRRMQGQIRHYRQNEAFRDAGFKSGLTTVSANTTPLGEQFTVVATDGVIYGRIGVNFTNRFPRPAKHRLAVASVNARLEPVNLDFFNQTPERLTEGLGILLVTVNPHINSPQDIPATIKVGVPYTNCKGWHLFESLESIMAAYATPVEIEVPDLALVLLKKRLAGKE